MAGSRLRDSVNLANIEHIKKQVYSLKNKLMDLIQKKLKEPGQPLLNVILTMNIICDVKEPRVQTET